MADLIDIVFTNGQRAKVPMEWMHGHPYGPEGKIRTCFDRNCQQWSDFLFRGRIDIEGVDRTAVPAKQRVEKILRHAWDELNSEEANKVVPKAIEYGSGDLKLMGYGLKMMLNSPKAREREWTEAESEEIACVFYTLGKVARMISAYSMGNMPTDDQPHDVGVYMRMVQILRRTGSWPPGFEEFLKEKGNE